MEFSFTQEQLMFRGQVIKFASREIAPRCSEHNLKGEFHFHSFRKLGEFGILGLHFPEELGGSNADVVTTVLNSPCDGNREKGKGQKRYIRLYCAKECLGLCTRQEIRQDCMEGVGHP